MRLEDPPRAEIDLVEAGILLGCADKFPSSEPNRLTALAKIAQLDWPTPSGENGLESELSRLRNIHWISCRETQLLLGLSRSNLNCSILNCGNKNCRTGECIT